MTGLQSFFDQQRELGDWDRGAPLFHYPQSGNAYCYIFETLGELLHLCDTSFTDNAAIVRGLLLPHATNLFKAFEYAESTARPIADAPAGMPRRIGWCSGNHPHRSSPESWATASTFRFLQGLRRVIGRWTTELALERLDGRDATKNQSVLTERGATWSVGYGSVGGQLAASFLHPIRHLEEAKSARGCAEYDPDRQVIAEDGARSAILYGPPGTSKTALVEALAGSLGWKFVEITPAQFLNQGIDRVSARADEIFRTVMELDRCVVLLDEIDQLIQRRDGEAESLDRFFTTTMLPRLAKLWELRKVLFFVNTNGIERVDPAIRRSQRFDSAILVMPPGSEAKRSFLRKEGLTLSLKNPESVALTLPENAKDDDRAAAWLRLVRHDQLAGLCASIKDHAPARASSGRPRRRAVSGTSLLTAIEPVAGDLLRLDWLDWDNRSSAGSDESTTPQTATFLEPPSLGRLADFQRRDSRMMRVVRFEGLTEAPRGTTKLDDEHLRVDTDARDLEKWAADRDLKLSVDGVLRPG